MKKLTLTLLLFLVCSLSFAGLFPIASSVLSLDTEHFTFYYLEDSSITARELAYVADSYYQEISGRLYPGLDRKFDVIITRGEDLLNAYYNPFPRSRIVMYDTLFSNGDLENNVPGILKAFYHELTHAISLEPRTPFFKGLATVTGNLINPYDFYLYPFFIEGVTVDFESHDGTGRLNNGFVTQLMIQAKIEGQFPKWTEIADSRDTVPGGNLYYNVGGAFSSFLEKTYSPASYAAFFEGSGSLKSWLHPSILFKRSFGVSLDEAYKAFQDSIEVPENIIEPKPYITTKGSYSHLLNVGDELYYIESYSKRAYKDSEELFEVSGYDTSLSIRPDCAYYSTTMVGYSTTVNYVYNRDKELAFALEGCRDSLLLDKNIVGLYRDGSVAILKSFDYQGRELLAVELDRPVQPFWLTAMDENRFCFLYDKSLYVYNSQSLECLDIIELDPGYNYKAPCYYNNLLYMSVAGDMARLGYVDLENMELYVSTDSYSGAVNEVSIIKDKVYFVSQFYEYETISCESLDAFSFSSPVALRHGEGKKALGLSDAVEYGNTLGLFRTMPVLVPLSYTGSGLGLSVLYTDLSETLEAMASFGYSCAFGSSLLFSLTLHPFKELTLSLNNQSDFKYKFNSFSLSASYMDSLSQSYEQYIVSTGISLNSDPTYKSFAIDFDGVYSNTQYYSISRFSISGFEAGLTSNLELYDDGSYDASASLHGSYYFKDLIESPVEHPFFMGLPSMVKLAVSLPFQTGIGGVITLFGYEIQDSLHLARLYFKRSYVDLSAAFVSDWDNYSSISLDLGAYLDFNVVYGNLSSLTNTLMVGLHYDNYNKFKVQCGLEMLY